MKTLILVRHGKAVIRGLGLADFNRSLTEKGQSESKKIARAIRDRGVIADLLVSSPALRARETAEIFSEVFGYPPKQILLRPEIY